MSGELAEPVGEVALPLPAQPRDPMRRDLGGTACGARAAPGAVRDARPGCCPRSRSGRATSARRLDRLASRQGWWRSAPRPAPAAGELGELAGQPALLLRLDEHGDQLGRGHEPHPVVLLAAGHPQGDGQMRLPRADPADEHDVGGLGDEAAVEDPQDGVAVEVRLRLEREGVQGTFNAA